MRITRQIVSPLACALACCAGGDGANSDAGADTTDVREADVTVVTVVDVVDVETPDATAPGVEDWVAFVRSRTSAFERVVLARADGSGGEFELPVDGDLTTAKHPAFAPDGSALVYTYATSDAASLRIFSLTDSTVADHLAGEFAALQAPDWSPDGTRVVFRAKVGPSDPWSTWIWTLADDSLVEVTTAEPEPALVSALAWNCDGTGFFHVRGTGGPSGQTDLWEMNIDGTSADQITFGRNPSNILIRVGPDCREVVIDSLSVGGPLRVGVSELAPVGMLGRGFTARLGLAGSDSNCAYAPGGAFVCQRLSGPAPDHVPCDSGGSDCLLDVVTIDGRTGSGLANATTTIDARETFPVSASVPGGFEP